MTVQVSIIIFCWSITHVDFPDYSCLFFHINFKMNFTDPEKNIFDIFIGIVLTLYIHMGRTVNLMIFNP